MPENSNRNMVAFVVMALAILFAYEFLVIQPQAKKQQALQEARAKAAPAAAAPGAPGVTAAAIRVPRAQALAASPRILVDTPKLSGSIALKGARFDDLHLKAYRQQLDRPETVELLRPEGVEYAHFAEFGWNGPNIPNLPTSQTVWTLASGSTLTPSTPVTLTYNNGAGLTFTRTIRVDDQYVFSISDTVANAGGTPVALAPYGSVQRQGLPINVGHTQIVHEGGIGVLGTDKAELEAPKDLKYPRWQKDADKDPSAQHVTRSLPSKGGWLGLTDRYWLAAMIPDQKQSLTAQFRVIHDKGVDIFDANYVGAPRTIAPGFQTTAATHLFAGAKTMPVLRAYEDKLGAPRFVDAIDWGMFFFITKPIFLFLEFIHQQVGNFGVAILALTVCVKALFFPLANKSYESITKMKKLQPLMEELKKKYANDPAAQQRETMALYQREKINPLMGCLPILIQIPVFYSLYKVLTVTIEMRQAPFFGWIRDLSARDPSTIWNLFGLIPWDPSQAPVIGGFLDQGAHIGACAIIYGFTMWLTQAMSPPAGDPMQQRIFQLLPIVFTLTLSNFAVGLIIYWTWNNLLSILQQYVIMHRFKVDNPIDSFLGRFSSKDKGSP